MHNEQETGRSWHLHGENSQKTRSGASRSLTQGLETGDQGPWGRGLPGGVMVPEVSPEGSCWGFNMLPVVQGPRSPRGPGLASWGHFTSDVFENVVFPGGRWECLSGSPRTLTSSLPGLLVPGATPGRP